MKTLLLTGFGPFLSNKTNPTETLVESFHGKIIGNFKVVGAKLPVSHTNISPALCKSIESANPDAVLSLGLAADRIEITPELAAINFFHCEDPDNDGLVVRAKILFENEDKAYFSTIDVYKIVEELKSMKIPAKVSTSAGTYVCNQAMYLTGRELKRLNKDIPWGFIHIPPFLDQALLRKALTRVIQLI